MFIVVQNETAIRVSEIFQVDKVDVYDSWFISIYYRELCLTIKFPAISLRNKVFSDIYHLGNSPLEIYGPTISYDIEKAIEYL